MTATTPDISPAVMALAHAIRRDIIKCLANGITTPGAVADEIGKPLGVVSYHFRMLAGYGVIEVERMEPRRGALQHYYRFTAGAEDLLFSAWTLAKCATAAVRKAGES